MTVVQSATQVNVSGSAADAFTLSMPSVAGGNALIGSFCMYSSNNTWLWDTVTDGGNTFVIRQAFAGISNYARAGVAVALNVTGGSRTVSFNTSGGSGTHFVVYGCEEISGILSAAAEETWDANDQIDITALNCNAGPITTTNAGDLFYGCAGINGTDATMNFASPTSWTNTYRQNNNTTYVGMDAGRWEPGSTQSNYTAQWTHDTAAGDDGCGVVVALKPVAGGPPDPGGEVFRCQGLFQILVAA